MWFRQIVTVFLPQCPVLNQLFVVPPLLYSCQVELHC